MDIDLWVGAATTFAGAMLGGSISLMLNRQQMRFAKAERQEEALEERYRRSVDRRFGAYSEFLTHTRIFRDSIRLFMTRSGTKSDITQIDHYVQSAHTASALVFLATESVATYDACRLVLSTMSRIQAIVHDPESSKDATEWADLNREMASVMRQFQVSARTELGVSGVEASAMLLAPKEPKE